MKDELSIDDLAVPSPRVAPRWSRTDVSHFVSDDGFARYVEPYRAGMALLPRFDARFDVRTSFGSVRVYRFDGTSGTPLVLLPGHNAATPIWRANLRGLLRRRTVYSIDLLGEAGLSVQDRPIKSADDRALWLEETLARLDLRKAHLLGLSIGGWSAVNYAVRRPGRIASLVLLDAVMTFAPIPAKMLLVSVAMAIPGLPETVRRRVLSWISGGALADDSVPEAVLLAAAFSEFVLRQPIPKVFSDEQLRSLDIPVLAFIAGRSVMLDAPRAAARVRNLLPRGQVELFPEASHAINGEYPHQISERAGSFWDEVDTRRA